MHAERPDGTRDPGRAGLLVGELTNRLAGDSDAGLIDVADLIAQAVALEAEGVRAKGIGFDDFGAGLQVVLMDAAHQFGLRQVQLVETAVEEVDAASVERSAHSAVAENGAAGKELFKTAGHAGMSCSMVSGEERRRQERWPGPFRVRTAMPRRGFGPGASHLGPGTASNELLSIALLYLGFPTGSFSATRMVRF